MDWDNNFTYLSVSTWHLNINGGCKAIKLDQNINSIGFKPQWVEAHVINVSPIQARELIFHREKSAPLTNCQPNWTTTS